MSVRVRKLPSGKTRYEVRWLDQGAKRSRLFTRRRDADEYDAELARLRRLGDLAVELERRRVTIADLAARWWEQRAPVLAAATVENYALHLDQRILPALADRRAATLTPADVELWIAGLTRSGDGDPTVLKAVAVLQAVLTVGVRDGVIAANPVAPARKPRQIRVALREGDGGEARSA